MSLNSPQRREGEGGRGREWGGEREREREREIERGVWKIGQRGKQGPAWNQPVISRL